MTDPHTFTGLTVSGSETLVRVDDHTDSSGTWREITVRVDTVLSVHEARGLRDHLDRAITIAEETDHG